MKVEMIALIFFCLGGVLIVTARAVDNSPADDVQHLGRRYAESTIASDISKIMDSMVQKNFVNFLLNQREKKSMPTTMPEDPEVHIFNDLLTKDFTMWVHSKGDRSKSQ
ncbi:gastric inhibitory polypeptide precursor [Astyanax mexicanus]|uniref:Gastric inhibitory polypeptide n=1 Tax=Astyanax mexicanus TaxID=7994 RepID=A0A8T2L936_ASTMX|nr:gastric inhibitory polypeptide precursor [Astyanax mexicanus]